MDGQTRGMTYVLPDGDREALDHVRMAHRVAQEIAGDSCTLCARATAVLDRLIDGEPEPASAPARRW